MTVFNAISQHLSARTGRPFTLAGHERVGGGSINRAMVIEGKDGRRYFVKLNRASLLPMFEAEVEGLNELHNAGAIRVPGTLGTGTFGEQAFLVLEYLDLVRSDERADTMLGQQLASLHRVTGDQFGWRRDNTIGETPQINLPCADWIEFYRERRLRVQFALAVKRGTRLEKLGDELFARLPSFFDGYRPGASLLHGDLWSGNAAATTTGSPVVFDPAVYFGDREADLAMTELFGGFSSRFYDAYRDAWPLDVGYTVRKPLYNLYHVLNHFNIFGGAYGAQAEQMTLQLLSDVR